MSAYQAALAGEAERATIGYGREVPGTVGAAVSGYLASLEFVSLGSQTTKVTYRRALEKIRRDHGNKPLRLLQSHHIKAIMAEMIETPGAANNFLRYMKLIINYAIDRNWIKDDPTKRIKKIKYDTEGFHTWSEDEIERFEDFWPVGTTQRLAFDLLLYTGQRSADVRQMRANAVGESGVRVVAEYVESVDVRQQKTKAEVTLPIVPALALSLNSGAKGKAYLLESSFGKPFTQKGFSNYMSRSAKAAGLPNCTAHGLRKSAATRLAEAGCSEAEIMAVTGHKTAQEVGRYTKAARQKLLAQGAMMKMESTRDLRRA